MSVSDEPKEPKLVPVDIRIKNVNDIPAKYFLHDEILSALQRVIRSDVVVHGNPVPPGAEAVFSPDNVRAARKRLAVANSELLLTLRKHWVVIVSWWIFTAGVVAITALIWRWINA